MQIALFWASRSLIDPVSPEMLGIVRSSVPRNRALGVGGVLYFDKTSFMQVLEGPEEHVEQLFVRVQDDKRHTDVRRLVDWPVRTGKHTRHPFRFIDGTRHRQGLPRLDFDKAIAMNAGQRRDTALALLQL